jgi:hypothetical protein
MMQEQNDSKHDLQNILFDNIYPDNKQRQPITDTEVLLKSDSDNNCCDRLCLWWFFHSSLGIYKYSSNPDDNRRECICCNFCTWCCEFRFKSKCCIKELGCCCITCSCE